MFQNFHIYKLIMMILMQGRCFRSLLGWICCSLGSTSSLCCPTYSSSSLFTNFVPLVMGFEAEIASVGVTALNSLTLYSPSMNKRVKSSYTNLDYQIPIEIQLYHKIRKNVIIFLKSHSLSKKSRDISILFNKTLLDSFWYNKINEPRYLISTLIQTKLHRE